MRLALLAMAALSLAACVSEPCERLSSEGRLNIVLVQDGFSDERFMELTSYVRGTILSKEPFASRPYISFYSVRNDDDGVCVQGRPGPLIGGYSPSPLPPLECDTSRVAQLVGSCGVERAKVIIVTNDTVASQTGVSYGESAVMFLDMKNQPPEVIQHEFAHFFGLVDEQARLVSFADGPGRRPAPNCAVTLDEAERGWRRFYPADHVFPQGCAGERGWYKPEEQTLLGRLPDPSYGYGAFNEWYLGNAMECCYAPNRTKYSCDGFFEEYPQWESCRG